MKETVRIASVLEVYNEAINTLSREKREFLSELKTLRGKRSGRIIFGTMMLIIGGGMLMTLIDEFHLLFLIKSGVSLVILIILIFSSGMVSLGIILLSTKNKDINKTGFTVLALASLASISSLVLLQIQGESQWGNFVAVIIFSGIVVLGIKLLSNKNIDRIESIKNRLLEIDNDLNNRIVKKRSLLEAEEVIIARDLKSEKKTFNSEIPVEPFDATKLNDEKVCPMCAETIKAAAKICRYCNHPFSDIPGKVKNPGAEN